MALSVRFTFLLTLLIIFWLLATKVTAVDPLFDSAAFVPPPPVQPPSQPHDEHSFFSHSALLPPILSHLGFHQLAAAAPSLSDAAATAWSGPSTLFAPSDASLRTCHTCSVPTLLREHIVPGLFSIEYLRKLSFGTKIETLSPGRCVTVTSDIHSKRNNGTTGASKVFVGGVEITHPDLFNNGLIVIHGIQGFISPLSPFSCDIERMTSLSFPYQPDRVNPNHMQSAAAQPAIMRLMLRDAMLRLRNNGFSILSLAMKVKYADLVSLHNLTIFALDDLSIFSGSYSYISNVRFHIVPNQYLTVKDLERLPVGTSLPTLDRGQSLVVTTAGGGLATAPLRINYVRLKAPDVMKNIKIVVHAVYLPFPHISPVTSTFDGVLGGSGGGGSVGYESTEPERAAEGACSALEEHGGCGLSPMPQMKATVQIEDHHGL